MKFLIDVVDAELFEVVRLEILEAKNVQETDRLCYLLEAFVVVFGRLNCHIHLLD